MTNQEHATTLVPTKREAMLLECLAEALGTNKKALTGVFEKDVKTIFFHGLISASTELLTVSRALDTSSDPEAALMGATVSAIQGRLDLSRELYEMVLLAEGSGSRRPEPKQEEPSSIRASEKIAEERGGPITITVSRQALNYLFAGGNYGGTMPLSVSMSRNAVDHAGWLTRILIAGSDDEDERNHYADAQFQSALKLIEAVEVAERAESRAALAPLSEDDLRGSEAAE